MYQEQDYIFTLADFAVENLKLRNALGEMERELRKKDALIEDLRNGTSEKAENN